MTRTLLVAPTGRRVGLTSTSLGILAALRQEGVSAGFVKPVAERRPDRTDELVRLLTGLEPPGPVPADLAEELLGSGRMDVLMEEVLARAESLSGCDVVVVEGLSPSPDHVWATRVDIAVARALDADVLLVTAGDLPDRELADAVAIAASPYLSEERLRIAGCLVNRVPDLSPGHVAGLAGALGRHGIELAGAVGVRRALTWPRVRDVACELGARSLVGGDTSRRVSDVLVCAQGLPGLLPLLREGTLLLVPGDRHDVVMAACLSALRGVELAGLLLTGGVEPAPEVMQLIGAVRGTGLPILVVDALTYPTAVSLHERDSELSPDDPEQVRAVAQAVAGSLDPAWLSTLPAPDRRRRVTPAAFRRRLARDARAADRRIVLPEGAEPRTIAAAIACAERGIARCVLLADPADVGLLPDGVEVLDPATVADHYVDRLVALRAHRGMTATAARQQLTDPVTVGMMMLEAGEADGLVSGAVHTTAATVRPALELIRVAPGESLVSSAFFMCLPDEVVAYADCAINVDPTAVELAVIAVQTADTAAAFGIEPRVAMISYSTGSSGAGVDVDKVVEATRLVRQLRPHLVVDGPLQYDAAAVASVASSKRPDSPVAGHATVFVFPDLNTGNTTYKAVQRSTGVLSIGPVLQGLAKPVNDLSRGALVEDIVYTIAVTALQARAHPPAGTEDVAGPGTSDPGQAAPGAGACGDRTSTKELA